LFNREGKLCNSDVSAFQTEWEYLCIEVDKEEEWLHQVVSGKDQKWESDSIITRLSISNPTQICILRQQESMFCIVVLSRRRTIQFNKEMEDIEWRISQILCSLDHNSSGVFTFS